MTAGGAEGTGGEGPSCLSVAPWLRKLDPPLDTLAFGNTDNWPNTPKTHS